MNQSAEKFPFKSVIFDLDGVVTKTALVHAQAWKVAFDEYLRVREASHNETFEEFTYQGDYLTYVDGKPRYEGVKSFLESRSINIDWGDASDSPDRETICGIGNRKNAKFREVLKNDGVEVYSSTIDMIKELKASGVKIGVASSSKNCKYILEAANIEYLFETRVDGEVSVELKLKGKPEGDIFVRAAYNLGTLPAESVVVEDASAGVLAGRNGGFGFVVGLARENNEAELLKNGADVAVSDLSQINLNWFKQWFKRTPRPMFDFWDTLPDGPNISLDLQQDTGQVEVNDYYIRSAESSFFNGKKLVFFLDYDGTLTPIVDRPELAVISKEMKEVVMNLSKKYTTAIVSGRMREDVEKLVGIEGLFYAGSHGFDIVGPEFSLIQSEAKQTIPLVLEITENLSKKLKQIEGALVEYKKFSVAVHYRLVDKKYLPGIRSLVNDVINNNKALRLMEGKKVFEILPAIDWNKGKAIRWIMRALDISWDEASVVYIGDDTTDEDAFRVLCVRGTSILVSDEQKFSAADFLLASPQEVKELFEKIIKYS